MATAKQQTKQVQSSKYRVLKTASTRSISGSANLTYQLVVDQEENLCIRVSSSDGGGFFSREAISISDILAILETWDSNAGITSVALAKLYRARSVNSQAFLVQALRAEGVLKPLEGKQRYFELGDVKGFLEMAKQLQDDGKAPAKTGAQKRTAAKSKTATKASRTRRKSSEK
jgi:hypothetical protein